MFGEIQMAIEKAQEREDASMNEKTLRNRLKKLGYGLHKSRRQYPTGNDLGGYMIYDLGTSGVVLGSWYELELEDVEDWLTEKERAQAGFVW